VPDLEYHVDAHDRISAVNEAWLSFAEANEGTALLPPEILGRSLWDFMGDLETQHIYQALHERVRTLNVPVQLCFRCDGPESRRLLELNIVAEEDQQLIYRVRTLAEDFRPAVPLLDPRRPRSETFVTICAWCKRVATGPRQWLEVEAAAAALPFFAESRPPQLTHGICEGCSERVQELLDGRRDNLILGGL